MWRITRISVAGILLLASCGGEQTINSTGGQVPIGKVVTNPFELRFGETATIENEGVSVTFADVLHDSRCPSDVVCIWPGMVEVGLQVIDLPSDTFFVPVSILPGSMGPIPPPKDTLGFRFALIDVSPYPVSTRNIPDSEYVAKLAIFRLDPIDPVTAEIRILNDPPPVGDAFVFDTVTVDGDILHTTMSHGGGCGDHAYALYFSPPAFAESFPAQADLMLQHVDLNDPCDAIISRDVAFDLRALAQYYELLYGRRDCITLNISNELSKSTQAHAVTVMYYPSKMQPSPPCSRTGN